MNCPTCGKEYTDEDAAKDENHKPNTRKEMEEEGTRRMDDAIIAALSGGTKLEPGMMLVYTFAGHLSPGAKEDIRQRLEKEACQAMCRVPRNLPIGIVVLGVGNKLEVLPKPVKFMPHDSKDKEVAGICSRMATWALQQEPFPTLLNAHAIMQEHIEKYHGQMNEAQLIMIEANMKAINIAFENMRKRLKEIKETHELIKCPNCKRLVKHLYRKDGGDCCPQCFVPEEAQ